MMLALDEQYVRWYWCMFEFECVITWYVYGIRCNLKPSATIVHSPAMQTHYNDNVDGSALVFIEYMEWYRVGFGQTESTLVLVHVSM